MWGYYILGKISEGRDETVRNTTGVCVKRVSLKWLYGLYSHNYMHLASEEVSPC